MESRQGSDFIFSVKMIGLKAFDDHVLITRL